MAKKETLPNGIRLIFEDSKGAPDIGLVIAFEGGRMHESRHQAGLRHLFEHLIGERSECVAKFRRACIELGCESDAETTSDMMMFGVTAPKKHFLRMAHGLIDLILNYELTDEEIAQECRVIKQEYGRGKDNHEEWLETLRDRLVYGNHPIGDPVIGLLSNIRRVTSASFARWWERVLDPRDMIITVVGSCDRAQVRRLLIDRLGHLNRTEPRVKRQPPRPDMNPRRCMFLTYPSYQVYYAWIIRIPFGYRSIRRLPAVIISRALGGHSQSIIHRSLRKLGLAYDLTSKNWFTPTVGYITLFSDTSHEDFRECLDVIQRRLAHVRMFGLPVEQFDLAVADCRHGAKKRHGDTMREGRLLTGQLGAQRHLIDHRTFIDRLNQITHEEVNAVLRDILVPENFRVAAIGPLTEADKRFVRRMFPPLEKRKGRLKVISSAQALTPRSA